MNWIHYWKTNGWAANSGFMKVAGKKTEGVLFAIVARLTTVAKTIQKAKEIRTRNFKNFVSSCRETIEFLNCC
jgi:hypothetical protein